MANFDPCQKYVGIFTKMTISRDTGIADFWKHCSTSTKMYDYNRPLTFILTAWMIFFNLSSSSCFLRQSASSCFFNLQQENLLVRFILFSRKIVIRWNKIKYSNPLLIHRVQESPNFSLFVFVLKKRPNLKHKMANSKFIGKKCQTSAKRHCKTR